MAKCADRSQRLLCTPITLQRLGITSLRVLSRQLPNPIKALMISVDRQDLSCACLGCISHQHDNLSRGVQSFAMCRYGWCLEVDYEHPGLDAVFAS